MYPGERIALYMSCVYNFEEKGYCTPKLVITSLLLIYYLMYTKKKCPDFSKRHVDFLKMQKPQKTSWKLQKTIYEQKCSIFISRKWWTNYSYKNGNFVSTSPDGYTNFKKTDMWIYWYMIHGCQFCHIVPALS